MSDMTRPTLSEYLDDPDATHEALADRVAAVLDDAIASIRRARIYRIDECGEATWVVATSPEEALALAGPCDDPWVVSEETDLGRTVTFDDGTDDGTTRTLREELAADPTPRIVCGTWT